MELKNFIGKEIGFCFPGDGSSSQMRVTLLAVDTNGCILDTVSGTQFYPWHSVGRLVLK